MNKLKLFLLTLISITIIYAANAGGPGIGGGSSSTPFTGGTLTSDLVVSDGSNIQIATGTAANLSFRLRSFPTTGVAGTGTSWSQYVLGVEALRLTATGSLIASGTETAGQYAIAPTNDTDTGITFPLLNSMGFRIAGEKAMRLDANESTAFGYQALRDSTMGSGLQNTAFGYQAGIQLTGGYNTFLGYKAGSTITNSQSNTLIGNNSNPVGSDNTACGWSAGTSASGNRNTSLGSAAGTYHSGDDNIYIGYKACGISGSPVACNNSITIGVQTFPTASNQVVIGSSTINDFQLGQGGTLMRVTATATNLMASGVLRLQVTASQTFVASGGMFFQDGAGTGIRNDVANRMTFLTNNTSNGYFDSVGVLYLARGGFRLQPSLGYMWDNGGSANLCGITNEDEDYGINWTTQGSADNFSFRSYQSNRVPRVRIYGTHSASGTIGIRNSIGYSWERCEISIATATNVLMFDHQASGTGVIGATSLGFVDDGVRTEAQRWTATETQLMTPAVLCNLSSASIDALTGLKTGTMVFNTDAGKAQCYDGSYWQALW